MTQSFDDINTDAIGREMKKYQLAVGTLNMDVKLLSGSDDVKDEVLEKFKVEFAKINAKLPVILALGNNDLKNHHWKEIY